MRRELLALLAAALLASPAVAQTYKTIPQTVPAASLPECLPTNEGKEYRVSDALTSITAGPGGAAGAAYGSGDHQLVFFCHNRVWVPRISSAEAILAPLHNFWRLFEGSPIIDNFNVPSGISDTSVSLVFIPNDPHVLYGTDCPAGSGFCMWYSLSLTGGPSGLDIYYATSTDGINWTDGNGGSPVMTDGAPASWYDCGAETPSVIKAGSTWLMAITAYLDPTCADTTKFTMGIASSVDGITWGTPTELTELTSVIAPVGDSCVDGVWGSVTRAEPGLLYVSGDARPVKLVFADIRCNGSSVERGISLADSVTGAAGTFSQVGDEPIVQQHQVHARIANWQGYSAPTVIKDGSTYLMAVSLYRRDITGSRQRGIATFSGSSLTTLKIDNPMALQTDGRQDWMGDVRAPGLVKAPCGTGATLVRCLYFAADNSVGNGLAATTISGADVNGHLTFRARQFGAEGKRIRVILNASSGGGSVSISARPGNAWTITATPSSDGTPTAAEAAAFLNAQTDLHRLVHVTAGGTGASAHGTSAGVDLSGSSAWGPPLQIGIGLARSL